MITVLGPNAGLPLRVVAATQGIVSSKKAALKVQAIKGQLFLLYSVKPGSILLTRKIVSARKEISQSNMVDRRWEGVPKDEYLMFIDVSHDKNFDVPVLVMLWGQSVVYIHHDNSDGTFDKAFGAKFAVVNK